MATEPQPLDSLQLIRRKRVGDTDPLPESEAEQLPVPVPSVLPVESEPSLRMKPREVVPLAAVHVRIPEHIARGLKLMSVLEGRQAQVIVAEALEDKLNRWNPAWRDSVSPKS